MARTARVIACLMVVVGLAVPGLPTPAPAVVAAPATVAAQPARADGLRIEAHTTFTLDPAGPAVRVQHRVTLTNQLPDQVSGGVQRRRYFTEFSMPALAESTNLVATRDDGRALTVRAEPTEAPQFSVHRVDLSPNLFYPSSQTFTVAYDLPQLPPRSGGFSRVNEAFATFPAFGVGDPGLTTVEVRVPEGFEVELIGDPMDASPDEGTQVFVASEISDPDGFLVNVVARDDDALVRRVVSAGDHDVVVLGWPDDAAWADFVADLVERGVPALEELLGEPWPAERDLDLVETVAPYLYGYGGWYMHDASIIEVGDELDAHVILHELAHVWFHEPSFEGRWVSEALADTFAAHALERLGESVPSPDPVRADQPGALPLNAWGEPSIQDGGTDDQEAYGYNASWSVLQRVVDEIGIDGLADAVEAGLDHEIAYTGVEGATDFTQRISWRTLLDLLSDVGGSTVAEDAFRDLVVQPEEVALLDERTEARDVYDDLVDHADGWAPPAELRREMASWRFDEAVALVPAVEAVLERRDDLDAVLADLDLSRPDSLRAQYEGARDIEELDALFADAVDTAEALRATERDREALGPLQRVGLLFSDVDDHLEDARTTLSDGDYERAAGTVAAADDRIDGATSAGIVRLGLVVGLVVVLVLATLVVRSARRRRGDDVASVDATGPSPPP